MNRDNLLASLEAELQEVEGELSKLSSYRDSLKAALTGLGADEVSRATLTREPAKPKPAPHAVGDLTVSPKGRDILSLVQARGEISVAKIEKILGCSNSHALKVLKQAAAKGMVSRVEGRFDRYSHIYRWNEGGEVPQAPAPKPGAKLTKEQKLEAMRGALNRLDNRAEFTMAELVSRAGLRMNLIQGGHNQAFRTELFALLDEVKPHMGRRPAIYRKKAATLQPLAKPHLGIRTGFEAYGRRRI